MKVGNPMAGLLVLCYYQPTKVKETPYIAANASASSVSDHTSQKTRGT